MEADFGPHSRSCSVPDTVPHDYSASVCRYPCIVAVSLCSGVRSMARAATQNGRRANDHDAQTCNRYAARSWDDSRRLRAGADSGKSARSRDCRSRGAECDAQSHRQSGKKRQQGGPEGGQTSRKSETAGGQKGEQGCKNGRQGQAETRQGSAGSRTGSAQKISQDTQAACCIPHQRTRRGTCRRYPCRRISPSW